MINVPNKGDIVLAGFIAWAGTQLLSGRWLEQSEIPEQVLSDSSSPN